METATQNLVVGLQGLGVEVVVVDPRVGSLGRWCSTHDRVPVETLGVGRVQGRSARARESIAKIAAKYQVNIVHGQGTARYLPANYPTVFTLHGILELEVATEEPRLRGWAKRVTVVRQERAARLAAPNVIAISAFNRSFLDPKRQRIWDIPNAISPHFYETPSTDRTPKSLYAGSLRGRKRVRELLSAFHHAAPSSGWRLAVAGYGLDTPYGQQCQADAMSLGIAAQVDWLGALSPKDLAQQMSSAHSLVLPSAAEGAPMVIAESMACGLPVIATDVGAAREMIEDGKTGLLVRPEDESSLTKALSRMMHVDVADGWSDQARQAAARYDHRRVGESTLRVYESVLTQESQW